MANYKRVIVEEQFEDWKHGNKLYEWQVIELVNLPSDSDKLSSIMYYGVEKCNGVTLLTTNYYKNLQWFYDDWSDNNKVGFVGCCEGLKERYLNDDYYNAKRV